MDDLWVVLPHLGAGGAQKVALLAAEHFSAQGYRVRVLTLMVKEVTWLVRSRVAPSE